MTNLELRTETYKARNKQCEEIMKLPAREVASALTFVWGMCQSRELTRDPSFDAEQGHLFATDVLNSVAARLGLTPAERIK